jgi:hypothetical protein
MPSTSKSPVLSPDTVSQAGAGALLLALGIVELSLVFSASEWWYRSGASLVAVVGLALLVRVAATVSVPLRAQLSARAARPEATPATARGDVFFAEWAQR